MNKGFELQSTVWYHFILVFPFWVFADIWEEQQLESVEQKFLCKSAQKSLDEEGEESMFCPLFEIVVGVDCDSMDEQSYLLIKCVFFIFQAFLSISLSITHLLLFSDNFLFHPWFLVKGWKEIVVAWVSPEFGHAKGRVSWEHHVEGGRVKDVCGVVGDKYKIFILGDSRFGFFGMTHLSIYDQKWKEL